MGPEYLLNLVPLGAWLMVLGITFVYALTQLERHARPAQIVLVATACLAGFTLFAEVLSTVSYQMWDTLGNDTIRLIQFVLYAFRMVFWAAILAAAHVGRDE